MKVLALEPYYGGSHRAFLDGWVTYSRHSWKLLTLPAFKWKWRMRHSCLTFSLQANSFESTEKFDVIFASDMLDVATFRAQTPRFANLPFILYFHENQLTYPNRWNSERDYHYAYTNFLSALVADQVWFNSNFHKQDFTDAMHTFLARMPDYAHADKIDDLMQKSSVEYPGVDPPTIEKKRENAIPTILWAARWEHDKNPESFFVALERLRKQGTDFRLNVLGQSFANSPAVFTTARNSFTKEIIHWGYVPSPSDYHEVLQQSDFIVATADHEFFGMGLMEAMASGVIPIVPARLSYPELLQPLPESMRRQLFYDGSETDLCDKLQSLIAMPLDSKAKLVSSLIQLGMRFHIRERAKRMDDALEKCTRSKEDHP